MPLFTWKKEYSVGVEELDLHHEKLFSIFNTLYENCMQPDNEHCHDPDIAELLAYSRYHFSAEEQYLRKIGYVEIEHHIVQHREFIRRVESLHLNSGNDPEISMELIAFLGKWLLHHVLEEDKLYVKP